MIKQQAERCAGIMWGERSQIGQIVAVHRDDVVKSPKIIGANLSRLIMADRHAVRVRDRLRPPVWR